MLIQDLPLAMYNRDRAGKLRRVGLDSQVFDTLTSVELCYLAGDLRVLADQVERVLVRRRLVRAASPKADARISSGRSK